MAYKNIHDGFWNSPNMRRLSVEERYLFAYFITNPHAHFSGIYYIPMEVIPHETGMGIEQIKKCLDTLSIGYQEGIDRVSKPIPDFFLVYDPYYQIVFIRNSLLYQVGNRISPQQVKGINKHLASLQPSHLIQMFIERYKEVGLSFFYPKTYPIKPFSENLPTSASASASVTEDKKNIALSDKENRSKQTVKTKIFFNYETGLFENIKDSHLSKWSKAFPAVDIDVELRKAEVWCEANPKNRKSNWEKFLHGWFSRAQDKARPDKRGNVFDRL